MSWDVIVVGARVAGASTALLLARAGARVLVLERGEPKADVLSTHALMRAGVQQLARWGLVPGLVAGGTPPIRETTFHYGDEALAIAVKPRDGVDALYAPRRTVLDPLLAEAAWDAGAEVRFGVRVTGLLREGERVCGVIVERPSGKEERLEAPLVIGADGVRSTVAALAGARVLDEAPGATATILGWFEDPGPGGYHWYFRPGAAAGVIPTNGGACLFVAVPPARFHDELRRDLDAGFDRLLAEVAPDLPQRAAAATEPLRASVGSNGFLRTCTGPGWALVGDAGAYRDPLTAHGMTDALRDAELLARAVIAGDPQAYAARRDELSRAFLHGTAEVASLAWTLPRLQELHMALNREMKRELEVVLALDREVEDGRAVG